MFLSPPTRQSSDEPRRDIDGGDRLHSVRTRQSEPRVDEPTPYDVVYRENKVRLRHYESDVDEGRDVPVVFAYALINTPKVLDLRRDRSVVGQFLARGFDVYLIEWGRPSRLDSHLALDDYVGRYLDNCVDAAREQSGADEVHLVGFSTGSPMVAMYAALFSAKVAALGLQGPPLDFHVDDGMLDFREIIERLDVKRLVDVLGNAPAELIDLGFALRKPVVYTVQQPLEVLERLDDPASLDQKARVASWTADGPDVAGETFRQFVDELLVENALIENELSLLGRDVDLAAIDMPTALILGADDAFVPATASLPFLEAIPSTDTTVFEFPTGHVGTLVDQTAHETGWPRVCEWFERRS